MKRRRSQTWRPMVEQAARNNALWCDTVCRAQGIPGEFFAEWWVNRRPVPRYYPNAVSLVPAALDRGGLPGRPAWMQGRELPPGWAVKDSFADWPLEGMGFDLLFEATWIERPAAAHGAPGVLHWSRLRTAAELDRWEAAWSADVAPVRERVFRAGLLALPEVAFLAGERDGQWVAGGIGYAGAGVVSISNVFYPAADPERGWAECAAQVAACFAGLPVIGYEHGRDLALALAAGFAEVHPLRVWVHR